MKRMRRPTEPWPFILAGLLLLMVSGSLLFLRISIERPDPLVVAQSHGAERAYGERLRAQRRALRGDWRIGLVADVAAGEARIRVAARDASGRPVELEDLTVTRVRPAEGGLDAPVELEAARDAWLARVDLPRPGRWHLRVRARRDGEALEQTFALWAPEPAR